MKKTTKNPENNKGRHNPGTADARIPETDIFVNDDEILLLVDLPGVDKENLAIRIEENTLTLHAARSDFFKGNLTRKEFSSQDFHRIFTLPSGICIEETKAELKNGLLYLHLPKSSTVKPVRIEVGKG